MGNNLICCKKTDNITHIINHEDELSNKSEEDYLNFIEKNNNNNNAIENEINFTIDPELPLDFQYNLSLTNNKLISKNIYDDNQQELLIDENSLMDEQSIYSIYNLKKELITKINEFYKLCNKNGKPRSTDDFNQREWAIFYPENETFFSIPNENNIEHNKLKIYNEKDINKMKIYQGDLNLLGERHGYGKFTTFYYIMIGMWKNDKFCGWGRESRCNGDIFEGRFENGLINGKGIFINSKNCKYIGDFKNMKRWGKGKLATDKIIYEGEFYDNMIHGKGRIKFLKNSVEYIGNFNKNKIDGRGEIKFKNGDKYDVEIKNGEIIKIENDIFENANGGKFDFLLEKRGINKGSLNQNQINNNYGLNGFQANGQINYNFKNDLINNFDNGSINYTQPINSEGNNNDLLLSTYRNFGFND